MIDLHLHSTGSDGQYTPTELIKKAKEAGCTLVSITDHDSVDGIAEGTAAASQVGIGFIPGIEISVKSDAEMHILGYGIDIGSKAIKDACSFFIRLRDERAVKIIEYLKNYGFDISLDEVKTVANGSVIARPHFAQLLLQKGYTSYYREAFEKYLATPNFDRIERPKPSSAEGIDIIKRAGGIAVLAHPVTLKKHGDELDNIIEQLVSENLAGIETYYSRHDDDMIAENHFLAAKYNLLETCGSDFHGEKVKPDVFIGMKEGGGELLADENVMKQITKSLVHINKIANLFTYRSKFRF